MMSSTNAEPTLAGNTDRTACFVRNPSTAVAGNADRILVCPSDQKSFCITKDVLAVLGMLEFLRVPRTSNELLSSSSLEHSTTLGLLALLTEKGVLLRGDAADLARVLKKPNSETHDVLLCDMLCVGICGAIQAASVVPLLHLLRSSVARSVELVVTAAASRFVNIRSMEAMGFRVWGDEHQETAEINVAHTYLASSSDAILVLPSTAHTLHKLAHGECSDLLSLVVAGTEAPVIIAPSMNRRMWAHGPIRRNVQLLREEGMYIVEPGLGLVVSRHGEQELQFGGPGTNELSLVNVMAAIMTAHRRFS